MGLKLSKILSEALDDDRAPHVKHLPTTSKLSKPASAVDDGDLHSTSENDKESSLQPLASAGAEALQPAKLPPSGDAEEDDHATEAVQSSEQVDMIKTSSQSSGNQCECGTEEYLMTTSTAASSDAAALRSIGATEATISLSTSNVLVRITLDALQRLLFGHDNSDNHVNSVLESVTPSPQDFFRLLQSLGANEELLQGLATAKIEALKLLILIHAGASKYSEISEIPHKSSSEHSTVGRTPSALGDSVGPGEEKIEETPSTAIPLPVCTPKPLEVLKSEHAASQLTAPPNISEAATLLLQQVVELKGDQDAVLQLCKCESVSCRAAYVISAIAMRSFVKLTTDTNLLQVQADRAQKAYTKAQSDLDGRLDELLETSKIALNYQQERDKALAAFKVLDEQLADPQSSQYLKFKVRRLEKENVEIPRLRERVAGVQGEHNELVRLPRTNATLQEMVDTAQETSDDYAQFQIAHENMKRELNSLKKSTDATEALEVKNKLNQARSTNEELLATNKRLQEELESAQSAIDAGADYPVVEDNDNNATAPTTVSQEDNNMGLPKFQLSSKAFNTEAVRALNYINKLNGTVVKRAAMVSGDQAGMGWDAFGRLEQLMEWVTKEGRTATKLVMGMEDAKEAKMESQGFPVLPLGKAPEQGGGKGKKGGRK